MAERFMTSVQIGGEWGGHEIVSLLRAFEAVNFRPDRLVGLLAPTGPSHPVTVSDPEFSGLYELFEAVKGIAGSRPFRSVDGCQV